MRDRSNEEEIGVAQSDAGGNGQNFQDPAIQFIYRGARMSDARKSN